MKLQRNIVPVAAYLRYAPKSLQEFSFIPSAFKDSFYAFEKCFSGQLHMTESLPVTVLETQSTLL